MDTRNERGVTVFALPSVPADIRVVAYSHDCRPIPTSYGAIICAAAFIRIFRGLPLDAVEVECGDMILSVSFSDNCKNLSLILPKCKPYVAKSCIFPQGIEKDVNLVRYESLQTTVAVTDSRDVDAVERSHLKFLLSSFPDADISVAYSCLGSVIRAVYHALRPRPDIPLTVALAAYGSSREREKKTVLTDGVSIAISPTWNGVRIQLPSPRFMSFSTPYL